MSGLISSRDSVHVSLIRQQKSAAVAPLEVGVARCVSSLSSKVSVNDHGMLSGT